MYGKRQKMSRKASRRDFKRKAMNVHPKNYAPGLTIRRGGIRA